MESFELQLIAGSLLLLFSVLASKASSYLGVPSLLLFLAVGMLAGSEGIGGIYFDDPLFSQHIGVVALVLILFSGGLDTHWESISPVLGKGLLLSTVGVVLTALLMGVFSSFLLRITLMEGVLLGAIVSSTDAAAIFSVLRSHSISLKGNLRPLLELESGSNDPMAVFLTMGLIQILVNPSLSLWQLLPMFVQQMALGALLGYGLGKGAVFFVNQLRLDSEGLYPVVTVAYVFLTYSLTSFIGGNGFLAVYMTGIIMGNSKFIRKRSIIRFHDGMAWIMQIAMFLTLGLLVFPSHLIPVMGYGILAALFLVFVARPLSVLASLCFSGLTRNEILMISWVGLRGAVPIILATYPLLADLPQSETFFNLVFFIVILSVLLQGTTIQRVANWLKVDESLPIRPKSTLEYEPSEDENSELSEFLVEEDSPMMGKRILELGLPEGVLIVLIQRNGQTVVPMGGTVLQPNDMLITFFDTSETEAVQKVLKKANTLSNRKKI